MASVTSLDKDLRNLRLEKYTPQRARETQQWIEGVLGERLGSGDLLEALKDGTALCKLVNLAVGDRTVRFKQSAMPFVQMENISHFLRACQQAPLSLPPHDCFLTVDLFEQKDPAQVLQCIGSFSRRATALNPSKFPTDIGGKKPSALSPQSSGATGVPGSPGYNPSSPAGRANPASNPTSALPGGNTWSRKGDIGRESPAWNIAQYGWTGGASQGNQGVAFGVPRQLVSEQPHVPSLAEKERTRREKALEAERQQKEAEEEATRRRAQAEEEERTAREQEATRWDEEAKRQRELDRQAAEAEKRKWEEEERRWKEEEQQRLQEEKESEVKMEKERNSRPLLQGQYLSQYQAAEAKPPVRTSESDRIKELERQLEEARERERKYEAERIKLDNQRTGSTQAGPTSTAAEESAPTPEKRPPIEDEWDNQDSERGFLRQQWKRNQESPAASTPRPLPVLGSQESPATSPRPLPTPGKQAIPAPGPKPASPAASSTSEKPLAATATTTSIPARPLPNPSTYVPPSKAATATRTDAFLTSNPAPEPSRPSTFTPAEAAFSTTAEVDGENARRMASQEKTRAGGWASKSLLEREMERDRERQREWEEDQRAMKEAAKNGAVDPNAGTGPGQSWDVNSYGYMGGDNLNKSGAGVYSGRRQIIGGPRPMGGSGK